MNEEQHCPRCEKAIPPDAPGGICPHCLLSNAMASDPASRPERLDFGDAPPISEVPGRYTCISEYARGGMGRVLLVNDSHLNRDVALKELLPEAFASDSGSPTPMRASAGMLARFLQEARITGQLEHPSIVPVYELGRREDGTIYYTMKLVRGNTLASAIASAGGLEERLKLLPHFMDLCQAIAYAHSCKVIHRDLKPANVMVGEFGETVVLDWGLAKVQERDDVHADSLAATVRGLRVGDTPEAGKTLYGQAVGTPTYMPPEQARGLLDAVDQRSDVYSLGAILYEVLTGKMPYTGKTAHEVLAKVLESGPEPVRKHAPEAPRELIAICERAMQRDQAQRYRTAREFAEEIQRFQSGALVSAYRYSYADRIARYVHRHRALMSTVVVATVLLLSLTAYYLINIARTNQALAGSNQALVHSRDKEILERQRAEELLIKLEHSAYVENLRRAQVHLEDNDVERAIAELTAAPQTLRDWEWGYLMNCASPTLTNFGQEDLRATIPAVFSADRSRAVVRSETRAPIVWDIPGRKVLSTLQGEEKNYFVVVFNETGTRISGATTNGEVFVWDSSSGALLTNISIDKNAEELASPIHGGVVTLLALSPDGTQAAVVFNGNVALIYDIPSGKQTGQLTGHASEITEITYNHAGSQLVTASLDQTVKLWRAATGGLVRTYEGVSTNNTTFTFSADDSSFTALSLPGHIRMDEGSSYTLRDDKLQSNQDYLIYVLESGSDDRWAMVQGGPENAMSVQVKGAVSIEYSNLEPRKFVTVHADGTAQVSDQEKTATLRTGGVDINRVEFSPEDDFIVVFSNDDTATVFELEQYSSIRRIQGPGYGAVLAADGKSIVEYRGGGFFTEYELTEENGLRPYAESKFESKVRAISADGKKFLLQEATDELSVREVDSGKKLNSFALDSADFSSDGAKLLSFELQKETETFDCTLWHTTTGQKVCVFTGTIYTPMMTEFSPDGTRLVTCLAQSGSVEQTQLTMFSCASGETLFTTKVPSSSILLASYFTPDSEKLVVFTQDSTPEEPNGYLTCRTLDARNGNELLSFPIRGRRNPTAIFTPDGSSIAISTEEGLSCLHDMKSGEELLALPDGDSVMAFSPDGTKMLTAWGNYNMKKFASHQFPIDNFYSAIKVRDRKTGKELMALEGHDDQVVSASYNPSGSRIVSSSLDNTLRVWDSTTGEELATPLTGSFITWTDVAFSPDGERLVTTGSQDIETMPGHSRSHFRTAMWKTRKQ